MDVSHCLQLWQLIRIWEGVRGRMERMRDAGRRERFLDS